MSGLFLYSTSVFLKLHIQERFRKDMHYVWCSEYFDSNKLSSYSPGSLVAPSANPADIYRALRRDVDGKDRHSAKIGELKASLLKLAIEWEGNGEIQASEKDEIAYMVQNASFDYWRPLIYIIPRSLVELRLQLVPPDKRAGFGLEYIISDLKRTEFDIIEI